MVYQHTAVESTTEFTNVTNYDIATTANGHCMLRDKVNIDNVSIPGNENEDELVQSTYNMENCNDVVVGPVTHFHCPVTIIQRSDKTEIPTGAIDKNADNQQPTGKYSVFSYLQKLKTRRKLLCVMITIFSVVIITVILVSIAIVDHLSTEDSNLLSNTSNNEEITGLLKTQLVPRYAWGARPPLSKRILETPVEYVLIAHTGGVSCDTVIVCSPILQTLQTIAIETKSPDIGYNFLIDSVGHIYVGRGWDSINYLQNHCISVAFMGNFYYDAFTEEMQKSLKALIEFGIDNNKIIANYTLLSHSQTGSTLSPGENIREVIKTWPHYYQKDFINLPD